MALMEGLPALSAVPGVDEPTRSLFLHRPADRDLHIAHLPPRRIRTSDQKSVCIGGGCSRHRTRLRIAIPCLTGKLTGNFVDSGSSQPFWRPIDPKVQMVTAGFPVRRNRELFWRNRECFGSEQGKLGL